MSENLCAREGCLNPKAKSQKYCSRNCAPLGHFGVAVTESTKKVTYSARGRGDPSAALSNAERLRRIEAEQEAAIQNTKPLSAHVTSSAIMPTQKNTGASTVRDIEINPFKSANNFPQTDSNSKDPIPMPLESSLPGSKDAIQLMAFVSPKPGLKGEKSEPTNYIDSSLKHLHELMGDVAVENPQKRTSAEMINAVCNISKNMTDLMKLKLEIYKAVRPE